MTSSSPTGRPLTTAEKSLISWILDQGEDLLPSELHELDRCQVQVVDGTETLRFLFSEAARETGKGSQIYSFLDADGIPFTAFLTFDDRGRIAELDLGKVDYSRIVRLPGEYSWKSEQTQARDV